MGQDSRHTTILTQKSYEEEEGEGGFPFPRSRGIILGNYVRLPRGSNSEVI